MLASIMLIYQNKAMEEIHMEHFIHLEMNLNIY